MNQTVTLVLLLSGTSTMPAERRALGAYQAREKVTLVSAVSLSGGAAVSLGGGAAVSLGGGAPAPPRLPTRTAAYSAEVALHVEAELDEAQTLATSLDEERALALLANVETELLAHPELPQAAWLMAERHQLAAAIRRKQPGGAEEAATFAASAEALEGPRAGAFGDSDGESTLEPRATALLAVRDLDPADTLVLDGRAASREESVLPGRHHARVVRGASVVWTGWLDVPSGPRVERVLGVPARVACSEEDLAEVTIGSGSPGVPRGVRCERWLGVRRGKTGLEVARCERERCEAYMPLPPERAAEKAAASLPPWLAATLVGAAAVGAGTILVLTGSFDRDKPPATTTWVYQGPK